MPDQPIAVGIDAPQTDEVAQAVLVVLLDRHPALMSIEELVQYFALPTQSAFGSMLVNEGLDDLARWGLVHRLDRFVFASYAAVRGLELRG
jgi:hypothetical protein